MSIIAGMSVRHLEGSVASKTLTHFSPTKHSTAVQRSIFATNVSCVYLEQCSDQHLTGYVISTSVFFTHRCIQNIRSTGLYLTHMSPPEALISKLLDYPPSCTSSHPDSIPPPLLFPIHHPPSPTHLTLLCLTHLPHTQTPLQLPHPSPSLLNPYP